MSLDGPKPDFTDVVDSVMNLFGEVMSREAIFAVVEHYGGNLNESIEAIMSMSNDQTSQNEHTVNTLNVSGQTVYPANVGYAEIQNAAEKLNTIPAQMTKTPQSYAGVSQARGAIPKQPKPTITNTQSKIWTLQTQQIVNYHRNGSRTLILMRGAPGSGKSFLAKQLLQIMSPGAVFANHIMCTDDFFISGGAFKYCKSRLPEAHNWNQIRAREAMLRGVSPVFIDNTNVEIWETEPYVKDGVSNGYIIEVLEPNTPWAKKAHQLAKKNVHDVPIHTIRRMLDNFQNGVSGLYLIRSLGLSYPAGKVPPVMRNFPPIEPFTGIRVQGESTSSNNVKECSEQNTLTQPPILQPQIKPAIQEYQKSARNMTSTSPSSSQTILSTLAELNSLIDSQDNNYAKNSKDENADVQPVANTNLASQIDDVEKLELEWENGEAWNEPTEVASSSSSKDKPSYIPQPPRNSSKTNTNNESKFLPSAALYNDWSNISMFMPAWNDYEHTDSHDSPKIRVETASNGTNVESGDTDFTKNNFKVISCEPRDINFFYMGTGEGKIPEKRMLDKSSMTNEKDLIASATFRCKNEEKHFITLRKLFKNVSKVELRDIFDKCVGDVNWAVCIVLDGMENNQLHIIDTEDISESEDIIDDEQCNCLAAYNVIPNVNTEPVAKAVTTSSSLTEVAPGPSMLKAKKDKTVLESSIQLKRQIEKSVVISDTHYSEHYLKLRKIRRGELNDRGDSVQDPERESTMIPSSIVADTVTDAALSAASDDDTSSSDDRERTVNIDLGREFVSKLDEIFGRNDFTYPDDVTTKVNMPVSLLNEIDALWMESLLYQLEQRSQLVEVMMRQDEEFARQLALKEEQLAQAGQEPAVPELKEIMDLELALSIYKKEITEEWRSNEPNDLAAKMTREKLYNLFPDVQQDILSELLMAHDNNFQATVEVLLSSTGNEEILDQENGVAKFVAKKELERQEKALEEQKKALSEVEWPLLQKNEKVDMTTVQAYRAKATQHLAQRNLYYQKAKDFYGRDMTQVANYYSDVANLHKVRFEQANSLAASSLMQVHAEKCTDNSTIDLHYLHVPEARESLDIFIDGHITKLRELQARGSGPRFHNLFFITGRGLHSHAGPRIKPAVKRRLRERGINFNERNPGLLASKVFAEDKLTHQLP